MDLYCNKPKCLCHWLCPSGHLRPNGSKTATGCTYLSVIPRHNLLINGDMMEICICGERCSGCRSAGFGKVQIRNSIPIIESFISFT